MSTRTYSTVMALPGLVLAGPLLAVLCTWLAAGRMVPTVGGLVLVLAGASAWRPDSHFGVLVIAAVAIQWAALVDARTSPWAIGVAAAFALFHSSLAAMTVAPPGARWTPAMCRRWLRRTALLVGVGAATWGVVVLVGERRPPGATVLVVASLLALALGGLWARGVRLWRVPEG